MSVPSILIVACDPYLAGIYGHKFESAHWQVHIAETLGEAESIASKTRPAVILLDSDCAPDISQEVKRLRSLPTILKSKIVILSNKSEREEIKKAKQAGAVDYLIYGHFVPREAVEKMNKLIEQAPT